MFLLVSLVFVHAKGPAKSGQGEHWRPPFLSKRRRRDTINSTKPYPVYPAYPAYPACYHQALVLTAKQFTQDNMLEEIVRSRQIMNQLSFSLPHYVDVVNVPEKGMERMKRLGLIVRDRTSMARFFKSIWHPVYNLSRAQEFGKRYTGQDNVPRVVQKRKDGWATYVKFLAWSMSQCKRVLAFDADCHFDANIEEELVSGPDEEFSAYPPPAYGTAGRGYLGINSARLLLTPSPHKYEMIVGAANRSEYIPFTNIDQDVLETLIMEGSLRLTSDRIKKMHLIHRKGLPPLVPLKNGTNKLSPRMLRGNELKNSAFAGQPHQALWRLP